VSLPFEVLLLIGVAGFYLYDSVVLLYGNEVIFLEENGQWQFARPTGNWRFAGKRLYLPNPLTPYIALFRMCWSEANPSGSPQDPDDTPALLGALVPLRWMVSLLFLLMLVALPLVMFLLGGDPALLVMFGLIYVVDVAMLVYVWNRRQVLQLVGRAFGSLAFECLACPPFALNMVRRVTERHSISGDPIDFAGKVLDRDRFVDMVGVISRHVDERLALIEKDDARYQDLESFRQRLLPLLPPSE
jgi:hypothetical protein